MSHARVIFFVLCSLWASLCLGAENGPRKGTPYDAERTLRTTRRNKSKSKSSIYSQDDRHSHSHRFPSPDKNAQPVKKPVSPTSPYNDPGDLNIRFNKIDFPDGVPEGIKLPLTKEDYPIAGETAKILRSQSLADAVVLPEDFDMRNKDPQRYVSELGGPPTYPNQDPNNPFWGDLEEVVDAQILRRANGVNPFTLPMLWEGYNMTAVADAVHNKYPGGNQASLLGWLYKDGLEVDYSVMPFRSNRDIVSLQFRFAYLNTWAIECVGAVNFCIKWSYGRPRPEEVAYQIATGELVEGVPDNLKAKIMSMNLENATSFSAYPEGSPSHPAWPAMHSAASAASFWLSVVANLTPEQYCEALRVDYAVAFGRTVAGVHYPTDNIMGLNLGQLILADIMPNHFAESFGSDPIAVRDKIERVRFDWNDFDVDECSIAGVPIVS